MPDKKPKLSPKQGAMIYLKSGNFFMLQADKFTVTRNEAFNMVTGIKWEGLQGGDPYWIDLTRVEAIIVQDLF